MTISTEQCLHCAITELLVDNIDAEGCSLDDLAAALLIILRDLTCSAAAQGKDGEEWAKEITDAWATHVQEMRADNFGKTTH